MKADRIYTLPVRMSDTIMNFSPILRHGPFDILGGGGGGAGIFWKKISLL